MNRFQWLNLFGVHNYFFNWAFNINLFVFQICAGWSNGAQATWATGRIFLAGEYRWYVNVHPENAYKQELKCSLQNSNAKLPSDNFLSDSIGEFVEKAKTGSDGKNGIVEQDQIEISKPFDLAKLAQQIKVSDAQNLGQKWKRRRQDHINATIQNQMS